MGEVEGELEKGSFDRDEGEEELQEDGDEEEL
jgi:hypothetical protein